MHACFDIMNQKKFGWAANYATLNVPNENEKNHFGQMLNGMDHNQIRRHSSFLTIKMGKLMEWNEKFAEK